MPSSPEKERVYYQRNRDRILAQRRERYRRDADKLKAQCRAYYRKNRDKRVAAAIAYQHANKDRITNTRLLREYGISLADKKRLMKKQRSRCATCHNKTRLVVDHSHATGKVRGLLCYPCNFFLGYINEQQRILNNLKRYVVKRGK